MGDIRKKYDAALKARIALEAVKGVFSLQTERRKIRKWVTSEKSMMQH